MEENKTAEEFIREKVRLKYNAINKMTKALRLYDVNGEECLRWAKEFSDLQLTQQQSANAELKQELSDIETAWTLAFNSAKRRGEKIAELKKQKEEAFKLIKDFVETYREGLCGVVDPVYLRSEKFISENTPPKN